MNGRRKRSAAPHFFAVLAVIFAAMAGLASVDLVLARMERAEVQAEAQRHFQAGERLVSASSFEAAANEFRTAVSVARGNRQYLVAWAQALFAAGKLDAAEEQANQLLDLDFSDGDANLLLARLYDREGRTADAIFSYRRAIYGRWPKDQKRRRTDVRWELTDLLSRQHASDDLLAELLLIQSESAGDPEVERRVAHLFLKGGPVARAIPLFEDLIRRNSEDADAVAGLARTYLANGDCSLALPQLRRAAQMNAGASDLEDGLALCEMVESFDPLPSGLAPQERLVRATTLLEAVIRSLDQCSNPDQASALKQARELPKNPNHNSYERFLETARDLWAKDHTSCLKVESAETKAISFLLSGSPDQQH